MTPPNHQMAHKPSLATANFIRLRLSRAGAGVPGGSHLSQHLCRAASAHYRCAFSTDAGSAAATSIESAVCVLNQAYKVNDTRARDSRMLIQFAFRGSDDFLGVSLARQVVSAGLC